MAKRVSQRTTVKQQLMRLLDDQTLDVNFVAAVAGDRPMNSFERKKLNELKVRRRRARYSDFLFALTHQYIPAQRAEKLWKAILRHKADLEERLGRNPGISVAAMDYLTNLERLLHDPIMVSDTHMEVVAEVAVKDGLTRLYDHTTFVAKLRHELTRFERYGHQVSVLMIDIDFFKNLNDTKGHQEGDRILRELGKILLGEIRDTDIAGRYGGEEFALILPHTDAEAAYVFAERLRKHVERRFEKDGPLTVSIGVATCPSHAKSSEDLIRAADQALYTSKQEGRNRTTRAAAP